MKKCMGIALALLMSIVTASAVFAAPSDQPSSIVQPRAEKPGGPEMPKDEPVSTTGTTYGWQGVFDLNTASSEPVELAEGMWDINDAQILFWDGTVIHNTGSSSLAVRDSYVRGETQEETVPVSDVRESLLTAGNGCTSLSEENSETMYVNSTVVSRNGAALTAAGALEESEEPEKALSLYTYGSEAITMDGGYGAFSDKYCNLLVYGSHIQAAEIGVISENGGNVTAGTIEEGEKETALASVLTLQDREKHGDRQLGSVLEGGRNALMVCTRDLTEIPFIAARITLHKAILRTDRNLDKQVKYEPQQQAYIDHGKGSVILIKSSNVDVYMEESTLIPDPEGAGNLIQTMYSNDAESMDVVPDGEFDPGVRVAMADMNLKGNIVHEDYQRDFSLHLKGTTLEGAANEYDCAHWNQVSEEEKFTDYCKDAEYNTHHGLEVVLQDGSVWNVTQESHLSRLTIGEDCKVKGIIYVNGSEQENIPGTMYEGSVVVLPGSPEDTVHTHNWQLYTSQPATCTTDGINTYICTGCYETWTEYIPATGHNWQRQGGSPADCTHNGTYGWVCYNCGATYLEELPGTALGHDWDYLSTFSTLPTCTEWGQDAYCCTRCKEMRYEPTAPLGHNWGFRYTLVPTCVDTGYDVYECNICGATNYINPVYPFGKDSTHGHDYQFSGYLDKSGHYYVCTHCGTYQKEPHLGDPCTVCGHSSSD